MVDQAEFVVKIKEEIDDDELNKKIEAAIEKRLKEREKRRTKKAVKKVKDDLQQEEEGRVEHPKGTPTSGRGLVSTYGTGPPPRKHYKTKRDIRYTPDVQEAPFRSEHATIPGFGGSSYVDPRGYQQEKVARRGNVRRSGTISPAFRALEESYSERQNRQEKEIRTIAQTVLGRFGKKGKDLTDEERGQLEKVGAVQKRFSQTTSGATALIGEVRGQATGAEFVSNIVLNMVRGLGPFGVKFVAALAAPFVIAELGKAVIKLAAVKGGPLNRDFRVLVENELEGLLSAEERRRRLLGIDPFIVSQVEGFQPGAGVPIYNSLESRDEVIISKIGDADTALGIES